MAAPRSFFSIVRDAIRHEHGVFQLAGKAAAVLWREGIGGIGLRVAHLKLQRGAPQPVVVETGISYQTWVEREYETGDERRARQTIEHFDSYPRISIICPVFNPDPSHLRAAIDSVCEQIYPHWQLCIADDASEVSVKPIVDEFDDERIAFVRLEHNGNISAASNAALELASGDHVTFLDQDDLLSPFALFWIANAINDAPNARLIYSDEDKIAPDGDRCDPHFKPDWNHTYQLAHNYLCHLSVYPTSLVKEVGGLRAGFEGAQDYDLALRVVERIAPNEIVHVPRVLYHWRKHPGSTAMTGAAKPYALDAGERALRDHLDRCGIDATVSQSADKYSVTFPLPEPPPPVTIVIPTRDQVEVLRTCIDSIIERTRYPDYRILVVDNGSVLPETLEYLQTFEGDVLRVEAPFNFSMLVNRGIEAATTGFVCLLNNDVEVIAPDWLTDMTRHLARSNVGIVGAKLLYPDDTIQHGGVVLGCGGVAGHAHKYFSADSAGYHDRLRLAHEQSAVTAACMLLKKSAWQQAGKFDTSLAVAFNDIDFCLKVADSGFRIVWTPLASLYHFESKTRGAEDTPEKKARFERERRLMHERWGNRLNQDPAYNPNLTLKAEDFSIAAHSRNPSVADVLKRHQHAGER